LFFNQVFDTAFPSEPGLRYFEQQITPALQGEINAQQLDLLYQADLLPTRAGAEQQVTLSFDGMLHAARSRLRCSSVTDACYTQCPVDQPTPRACRAQAKGKRGCACDTPACAERCRYTTPRDPEARFIVYQGSHKRAKDSPHAPQPPQDQPQQRATRFVYPVQPGLGGYYSYAGQILDLATYWILPAAFAPATTDGRTLFPESFPALQERFPWLHI